MADTGDAMLKEQLAGFPNDRGFADSGDFFIGIHTLDKIHWLSGHYQHDRAAIRRRDT